MEQRELERKYGKKKAKEVAEQNFQERLENFEREEFEEEQRKEGPGYMGWQIQEDLEKAKEEITFQERLEEMKSNYDELKTDFIELKKAFEITNLKLEDKSNEKYVKSDDQGNKSVERDKVKKV